MRVGLVALALVVGCRTPREHLTTAVIGGGAAIAGFGLYLSEPPCMQEDEFLCDDGPTDREALGAVLVVGGLLAAFVALITYPYDPDEKPAAAPPPAQPPRPVAAQPDPERTARQERAWSLTKSAAAAARAGDCGTVQRLDAEVRQVDAAFHESVFVRDVAIAACLQP